MATKKMKEVEERSYPLLCLFLFALVEVLGFTIVFPMLPYLTEKIMTPVEVGYLASSNALVQFIATPIIGSLSDRYGRRPLLLLSAFSTIISFLILANAETKFWFFFSRVFDGMFGGNLALARAYITDITVSGSNERTEGIGMIGFGAGIGFALGPIIGGGLLSYHHTAPGYFSVVLSLVNLVVIYFYLPESLPVSKRQLKTNQRSSRKHYYRCSFIVESSFVQSLIDLYKLCTKSTEIMYAFVLRYAYIFIIFLFQQAFMFHSAKKQHTENPELMGLLLGWFSLNHSFSRIYPNALFSSHPLVTRIRNSFSVSNEKKSLFLFSLVVQSICFVTLYFTCERHILWMFVTFAPLGFFSGILETLIYVKTITAIEKNNPRAIGGGLGVCSSAGALARISAPLFAGYIVESFNDPSTLFLYCAYIYGALLIPIVAARG